MELIDKSALVAETERRMDDLYDLLPDASKVENGSITTSEACNTGKYTALESFRRFIDTLEVKEVDLEKAIDDYIYTNNGRKRMALELDWKQCDITFKSDKLISFAKHFFELGMQVSSKAQKDLELTWEDIADILDVTDVIANDDSMEERLKTMSEEEYCQEVLKRFKEQKGEEV